MKQFIEKVKKKYDIPTTADFFVIVSVFSLAGTTDSLAVKSILRPLFHIVPRLPLGLKIGAYIIVALPLYQFFLLVYGLLLGQFKFFWERERRLGRWLRTSCQEGIRNLWNSLQRRDSKDIQHKIN